jgi:RNA polymerase sigma-70 factor, ECF subfamily
MHEATEAHRAHGAPTGSDLPPATPPAPTTRTANRDDAGAPSPPDPRGHDVDLALMRRVRDREEAALAALYDRYATQVNGLARSILRDPEVSEEATHDVFLRLWQRPESYDPGKGTFGGWLLRVTRNRAIDLRRRQRETPASGREGDPLFRVPDPAPPPEEQALAHLRRQEVRQALAELAPDQRQLLELAYDTGLTQRQIAERLERPLGTVKSQIRAAMRRLADRLAPPEQPSTGMPPEGSE